ncbi:thiosulfate oxidation carrier protein SoxY [Ponticaulis sp.]|uniref:thiosulfate oxidation carrier protein SoxY n=1 Tax=Ponticaulis sp. TaxID=2020902 RepID=UPI002639F6EF|nr:thiosulfate oxidation carrier protein SoxY [Ponticaulis sp.]MDF1681611.1 thiosulfate oxidation carrier protein SoxY [Ponticaulis sp.]
MIPRVAAATEDEMNEAISGMFGDRVITEGRVNVDLPPIAENGFSVPIDISVDSPMTEDDYVKQIVVLSPRNPLPVLAQYHLTPMSGRGDVSARIRLGGTQSIRVIAEMNDGTLWSGAKQTLVTLAACVID